MNQELRPELEPIPARMQSLPIYRGYPVPWFFAWIDGKPEFRVADGKKFKRAVEDKLCWVCGGKLGRFMTFVVGPMCGITRTTAEPPCHLECAQWSAKNCPFLSRPEMVRRENDIPEDAVDPAGFAIRRNPGVTLLWTTKRYRLFGDGSGGTLINIGEPVAVEWWSRGKPATREQVSESIAGGLPKLEAVAMQTPGDLAELQKCVLNFNRHLPQA